MAEIYRGIIVTQGVSKEVFWCSAFDTRTGIEYILNYPAPGEKTVVSMIAEKSQRSLWLGWQAVQAWGQLTEMVEEDSDAWRAMNAAADAAIKCFE